MRPAQTVRHAHQLKYINHVCPGHKTIVFRAGTVRKAYGLTLSQSMYFRSACQIPERVRRGTNQKTVLPKLYRTGQKRVLYRTRGLFFPWWKYRRTIRGFLMLYCRILEYSTVLRSTVPKKYLMSFSSTVVHYRPQRHPSMTMTSQHNFLLHCNALHCNEEARDRSDPMSTRSDRQIGRQEEERRGSKQSDNQHRRHNTVQSNVN